MGAMVRIRCLAQLVNAIAPIMTGPGGGVWRQASYRPFALTSRYGRGMVLRLLLQSPVYETGASGDVPVLEVDVRPLPSVSAASHVAISDDDLDAVNTLSSPDRVVPKTPGDPELGGGRLQAVPPPLSWNRIRLSW